MNINSIEAIKNCIESHPDFPKKGIIFRDMLPIMRNPSVLEDLVSVFCDYIEKSVPGTTGVAGLEARGFLFGPIVALRLGLPFIPIRKAGKLPGDVKQKSYSLEYGMATIELQSHSIQPGQSVVIVDDLMATGGTMAAAVQLLQEAGGKVPACLTIIELVELNGKEKLNVPFHSFVKL